MQLSRNTRNAYIAMASCLAANFALMIISHDKQINLPLYVAPLVFVFRAGFVLVWLRLMRSRFLHPTLVRCTDASGALMVGWLLVQVVSYDFMRGYPDLRHFAWYAYYIFYLLIPTILLIAVLHAGKRPNERIDTRWWILVGVAAIMAALFVTNDLHELAFVFDKSAEAQSIPRYNRSYTYGPLYALSWVWTVALAVIAVVASFAKVARARKWHVIAALLVPLALGAAYSILSFGSNRLSFLVTFPDTACFLIVIFMEILVRGGLFPGNEGYDELWRASTLRSGIMDANGAIRFASADMPEVSPIQIEAALHEAVPLSNDLVLASRPLLSGTVFWVRNLAQVRKLQAELIERGDIVAEENAMLEAEQGLTREQEAITQRALLHARIMDRIEPELARIENALDENPADEEAFLALMRRAAVRASYVKRAANLMLAGDDGTVDGREVGLAFSETGRWLSECDVPMEPPELSAEMPTDEALAMYRACTIGQLGDDAP